MYVSYVPFPHLCGCAQVLVVAHRLSTVQHADRIIVVVKGQVQEVGEHDLNFAPLLETRIGAKTITLAPGQARSNLVYAHLCCEMGEPHLLRLKS